MCVCKGDTGHLGTAGSRGSWRGHRKGQREVLGILGKSFKRLYLKPLKSSSVQVLGSATLGGGSVLGQALLWKGWHMQSRRTCRACPLVGPRSSRWPGRPQTRPSPEAMPIRKRRSGHWEYGLCPQDLVLSPGVCQVVFKNHTVRVMRVKCPFIPEKPREVPLGKKNFKVLLSKTSPFRQPRSFTCKWKGQANVWGGGPSLANRPRAVNLSGPSMTFHWLMAWASLVALTKLGRFSVSRKIEHT